MTLLAALVPLVACSAADEPEPEPEVVTEPTMDPVTPTEDIWGPRADAALEAMLVRYWNGTTLDGTQYWTYAQAWDAVLDGIERTGRYHGWIETMYLAVELAAGAHTISVVYNSGKGSAKYLNVDWLELAE